MSKSARPAWSPVLQTVESLRLWGLSSGMDDNDDKIVEFRSAAKRQKKPELGSDQKLLRKMVATAVIVATVALGYYALYGIN
jgi:hypothetical protein